MKAFLFILLMSLALVSVCHANPFAGGAPQQAVTADKPHTNSFYTYLTAKQREIRSSIAGTFRSIKEKPFSAELFMFALLSFSYGVFHSMGPGHAKSLVSGYLLSTDTRVAKAALFGTVVAFGHAFSSFFLVSVLYYVMKASVTGGFDSASDVLSKVSFAMIFCIGLYMLYKKIRPSGGNTDRGMIGSAAVISLTPCPGAMVLAMFCFTGGLPALGFLSVLFMALGMALTISTVAVLTALIKLKGASGRYRIFYGMLEYAGVAMLLGFSGFMMLA